MSHPAGLSKVLVVVALWASVPALSADEPTAGKQIEQTFEKQVPVTLRYLLYVPKDYEQQESWPLLLFLHGSGERGDNLEVVKKHGPPRLAAEGKELPFIVVSPQCPADRRWRPFELSALLDDLQERLKVDRRRVYVTGLSMGGYGTWELAAFEPRRFAAIVPICGGGDPRRARDLAPIPTWVFHGAKDNAVPLARSQEMVDAIQERGGKPKFTIYPEAGHDSWTEAYNTAELYTWLLEQKLAD